MPIVKQNSWSAGEINPNLTEASSNPLYFEAALKLENVYVAKSQTIKRMPATEMIPIDDAPILPSRENIPNAISASYNGRRYTIVERVVGTNSLITVYRYNSIDNIFEKICDHVDNTPLPGDPFIDYVVFENKVTFTFTNKMPNIIEFDTVAGGFVQIEIFKFLNQPTLDFNDVDYSEFIFTVTAPDQQVVGIQINGTNVSTLITDDWLEGMFYSLGDDSSEFLGQAKLVTRTVVNANEIRFDANILNTMEAGAYKGARVILQKPIFFNASQAPKVVSFFDGRIYFGNTQALPMLIAGSQVNQINNFNVGKALPAEAVVYVLNDTTSSEIRHIVGHIGLFIFTDNNEHVVIPSIEDGITPQGFISQRLSDWGSSVVQPVVYNNNVVFVNKTSRKILSIDSSSSNSFALQELTLGMDIDRDILVLGIINDSLIDNKLLIFSYTRNVTTDPFLFALNVNGEKVARTKFLPFFDPLPQTTQLVLTFSTDTKTFIAISPIDPTSPMEIVSFTDRYTGVVGVFQPTVGGMTVAINDGYLIDTNLSAPTYTFIEKDAQINGVDGVLFGGVMPVSIQSIPLILQNAGSWDYKKISYLFISYFNSAKFIVNGIDVAHAPFGQIETNPYPLSTAYVKLPQTNTPNDYNYIEISTREPYNIEIQAYGWSIRSTIID